VGTRDKQEESREKQCLKPLCHGSKMRKPTRGLAAGPTNVPVNRLPALTIWRPIALQAGELLRTCSTHALSSSTLMKFRMRSLEISARIAAASE
jgi:hypothetical protein